ncbi:mycothiol transferase [Pseudarthrobacter chlorophenolicus]|uniref:mycothiol transferase n=1 Tax=Pseudarthrobacter chlorophenolicus TaxID=85085 RepID=UPI0005F2BB5E|nr:DUF664 domain-containing protein [Pseudarthrobacter chlorophenolicus]
MTSSGLLQDAFVRISDAVTETLEGLDEEALHRRPAGTGNPIAWLVWHLARVEDAQVAAAAGIEQVWTHAGFAARFGLPLANRDTGYGHTRGQVDSVRTTASLLGDYYEAVHRQTMQVVGELADQDLDRIVDANWDPPVTLSVRLVSTLADCLQHVGQAGYAKGLAAAGHGNGRA